MDKRETGGKGHSGQSIGSLTTQVMIINFINENADFQEQEDWMDKGQQGTRYMQQIGL
jgi:hypothetical protein